MTAQAFEKLRIKILEALANNKKLNELNVSDYPDISQAFENYKRSLDYDYEGLHNSDAAINRQSDVNEHSMESANDRNRVQPSFRVR
jgi:hypothetical protein